MEMLAVGIVGWLGGIVTAMVVILTISDKTPVAERQRLIGFRGGND